MRIRTSAIHGSTLWFGLGLVAFLSIGCSSNSSGLNGQARDASASDGKSKTGGVGAKTGGVTAAGGMVVGNGGAPGTGGVRTGGVSPTGGVVRTGGLSTGGAATGGTLGAGGLIITGGVQSGGMARTGGAPRTGGVSTGGLVATGGKPGTGGMFFTGGSPASGGAKHDGGLDAIARPDARDTGSVPCTQLSSLLACDERSDCHAVFTDSNTCNCLSPGCCAVFTACAAGSTADCNGNPTCKMATPYCAGPYVVAYTQSCYDGCVRQTACAPVDAGAPDVNAVGNTDTAVDAPALVDCSTVGTCGLGQIVVRVVSTAAVGMECACMPNPCGNFPGCDCGEPLCANYGAACVGYAPGSGHLICER